MLGKGNKNETYTPMPNTKQTIILSKSYKFTKFITYVLNRLECNERNKPNINILQYNLKKMDKIDFLNIIKSLSKCIKGRNYYKKLSLFGVSKTQFSALR